MGDNEVELVRGYLKLSEELKENADKQETEVIKAKMEGIVWCYEAYTPNHWETFERLLKRYKYYMRASF